MVSGVGRVGQILGLGGKGVRYGSIGGISWDVNRRKEQKNLDVDVRCSQVEFWSRDEKYMMTSRRLEEAENERSRKVVVDLMVARE